MKRILRICRYAYSPKAETLKLVGGAEIQIFRLIEGLSDKIVQDVFTAYSVDFELDNVTCYHPKERKIYFETISLFFLCMKHLRKNKNIYDAIQIHSNGSLFPFVIGNAISLIYKLPVVYTFHCSRNVTYRAKKIEFLSKHLMNFAERKSIQRASCNVFLSKYIVDKMFEKNILSDSINFEIIGDAIQTNSPDISKEKEENSDKANIVFLGRISPEKGWDVFVECANKLRDKDYIFNMYGLGHVEKLNKKIKEYNLNKLIYHGFIPNKDVFKVFSKADIVVIPSYYEELGSVVLEAGLMKKTVIASKIGALEQILADSRGYTVDTGDVDGFCEKIVSIVENNDYQSGERLYEYICENYSLDNAVKKYMEVYNSL